MSGRVLLLRPEAGASESAARARRLGLEPVVAPLFTVSSVAWAAPEPSDFDALLLTSANSARHGGPELARLRSLRCHAVGEATAAAAEAAGFRHVVTGPGDGAAALEGMAKAGIAHILHLCGRDHLPLAHPLLAVERRIVYRADATDRLPEAARTALGEGALALVHSPRAGALFGALVDRAGLERGGIRLAAISAQAAAAAGFGWRQVAAAARPRDEALLELAVKLCQTEHEAE